MEREKKQKVRAHCPARLGKKEGVRCGRWDVGVFLSFFFERLGRKEKFRCVVHRRLACLTAACSPL